MRKNKLANANAADLHQRLTDKKKMMNSPTFVRGKRKVGEGISYGGR